MNNPQVGLVTPETDPLTPTHKIYDYLPPVPSVKPGKELDYDPQLVWAGPGISRRFRPGDRKLQATRKSGRIAASGPRDG